jgi:hypothetical protein
MPARSEPSAGLTAARYIPTWMKRLPKFAPAMLPGLSTSTACVGGAGIAVQQTEDAATVARQREFFALGDVVDDPRHLVFLRGPPRGFATRCRPSLPA